jgi:hypothetical protein
MRSGRARTPHQVVWLLPCIPCHVGMYHLVPLAGAHSLASALTSACAIALSCIHAVTGMQWQQARLWPCQHISAFTSCTVDGSACQFMVYHTYSKLHSPAIVAAAGPAGSSGPLVDYEPVSRPNQASHCSRTATGCLLQRPSIMTPQHATVMTPARQLQCKSGHACTHAGTCTHWPA